MLKKLIKNFKKQLTTNFIFDNMSKQSRDSISHQPRIDLGCVKQFYINFVLYQGESCSAFTLIFSKGDITIFKELLINDQIVANEVRLIGQDGEQLGIVR